MYLHGFKSLRVPRVFLWRDAVPRGIGALLLVFARLTEPSGDRGVAAAS